MKSFRKIFVLLLLSIIFTFLILIFFKPILTANNLIFPYSVHPFDIAKDYSKSWFYMKITYCFTLFLTIFLISNSISVFFKLNKKSKNVNKSYIANFENKSNLNLLVGFNSDNEKQIFINEKGLYQNILVTGTIGSRKNQLSYVSIFRATNEI